MVTWMETRILKTQGSEIIILSIYKNKYAISAGLTFNNNFPQINFGFIRVQLKIFKVTINENFSIGDKGQTFPLYVLILIENDFIC